MIRKYSKIIGLFLILAVALTALLYSRNKPDLKAPDNPINTIQTTKVELVGQSSLDLIRDGLGLSESEMANLDAINFEDISCSSFNRRKIEDLEFTSEELGRIANDIASSLYWSGDVFFKSICESGDYLVLVDQEQINSDSGLVGSVHAAGGGTGYDTHLVIYSTGSGNIYAKELGDISVQDIAPINISSSAYFSCNEILGKEGSKTYMMCGAGDGPISKKSLRVFDSSDKSLTELVACEENRVEDTSSCHFR